MNKSAEKCWGIARAWGVIYEKESVEDPWIGYWTPGGGKNLVGSVYVNFSEILSSSNNILHDFSCDMEEKIKPVIDEINFFCGVPSGGYAFVDALESHYECEAIKAESRVINDTSLSESHRTKIIFDSYEIQRGASYAIVDDVFSDFSQIGKIVKAITAEGGKVSAIICFLNKSLKFSTFYPVKNFLPEATDNSGIKILSLVRKPIPAYGQDNPIVAGDVMRGNVVWDPQKEWSHLMKIMKREAV